MVVEQLYTVEIFVETLKFFENEFPEVSKIQQITLEVEIGDIVKTQIRTDLFTALDNPYKEQTPGEYKLNCGKLVMFSSEPKEMLEQLKKGPFRFNVFVSEQMLAYAEEPWKEEFFSLAEMNVLNEKVKHVSATMDGEYNLMEDLTANIMGNIQARIRLSVYGATIESNFKIKDANDVSEKGKQYLFRNEDGTDFQCEKGEASPNKGQPNLFPLCPILNSTLSIATMKGPFSEYKISFTALSTGPTMSTTPEEFESLGPDGTPSSALSYGTFDIVSIIEREPKNRKALDLHVKASSTGFSYALNDEMEQQNILMDGEEEELTVEKIEQKLCKNLDCPALQKFKQFGIGPLASTKGTGKALSVVPPCAYGLSNECERLENFGPAGLFSRPKRPDDPFVHKRETLEDFHARCWKPRRENVEECSSWRLRGGGVDYEKTSNPLAECQDIMKQFDEVLQNYKRAIGPCGKVTCPFVPNITIESCKTACKQKKEVVMEDLPKVEPPGPWEHTPKSLKGACGSPKCPFPKYREGVAVEDDAAELQYLPLPTMAPCGSPECPKKYVPVLPPIHWDCPDPLPKGRCTNPNCPYLPGDLRDMRKELIKRLVERERPSPCEPPPPQPPLYEINCGNPSCPFAKPKESDCYMPGCPMSQKQQDDTCDNPECPYAPPQPPCPSPSCPYASPPKINRRPGCPLAQQKQNDTCDNPECPYAPPQPPCPNPSCPYASPPKNNKRQDCFMTEEQNDTCGNPECPYAPTQPPCPNPSCPYASPPNRRSVCPLPQQKQNDTCGNPTCPYAPSQPPCPSPSCPYASPPKRRQDCFMTEEQDDTCDNPECPYAPSQSTCPSPSCPYASPPKINRRPGCPLAQQVQNDTCDNPECPYAPPQPPCPNPSCPYAPADLDQPCRFNAALELPQPCSSLPTPPCPLENPCCPFAPPSPQGLRLLYQTLNGEEPCPGKTVMCYSMPPCSLPPCPQPPCLQPPCLQPPCSQPPCSQPICLLPPCARPPCSQPPCPCYGGDGNDNQQVGAEPASKQRSSLVNGGDGSSQLGRKLTSGSIKRYRGNIEEDEYAAHRAGDMEYSSDTRVYPMDTAPCTQQTCMGMNQGSLECAECGAGNGGHAATCSCLRRPPQPCGDNQNAMVCFPTAMPCGQPQGMLCPFPVGGAYEICLAPGPCPLIEKYRQAEAGKRQSKSESTPSLGQGSKKSGSKTSKQETSEKSRSQTQSLGSRPASQGSGRDQNESICYECGAGGDRRSSKRGVSSQSLGADNKSPSKMSTMSKPYRQDIEEDKADNLGVMEYSSDTRINPLDTSPCTKKTCKGRAGGNLECDVCGAKKGELETVPEDEEEGVTCTDETCQNRQEVVLEETVKRHKKIKGRYVYSLGNRYPRLQPTHKKCVMSSKPVPAHMGWLWNLPSLGMKKRKGWRPGMLGKTMAAVIQAHREKQGLKFQVPVIWKKGKPRGGGVYESESEESIHVEPRPTLQIKKKDGAYFVTMNPLKDPYTLVPNEDPYMNCTPIQFKISKNTDNKEVKSCFCDGEEMPCESSSSESELDIEFTPPAGLIHPERFHILANVVHTDTQYLQADYDPEAGKKKDKKGKKGKKDKKGKKGKKGKGKKKK